jgi:hypothetical protein
MTRRASLKSPRNQPQQPRSRATVLSYLLESPAGVDDAVLVEELTQLIVRYLSAQPDSARLVSPRDE